MTSQIMSNLILLLNNIIDNNTKEINEDNINQLLVLLEYNIKLSNNINSYNPRIIPQIILILEYVNSNSTTKNSIYKKIGGLLSTYSLNNKNNINFEIIFNDLTNIILDKKLDKYLQDFLENYSKYKELNNKKKYIKMNFMITKKKQVKFLEADYDLGFLGDNFVNEVEYKKKMDKILKKKLKDTQKQTIRKLKKEAKVIDQERTEKVKEIREKRLEDIKFVNQYMEQQNIEYKKMMSSNERKRFKFKKKKNVK
jgi:hypothetical protein